MIKHGFLILLAGAIWVGVGAFAGQSGSDSVLSPALKVLAKEQSTETVAVSVMVSGDVDLGNLVQGSSSQSVGGFHWVRGKVQAKNLSKLASLQGVVAVNDGGPRKPPVPPDPGLPKRASTVDKQARQKALKSAPAYTSKGLKVGQTSKTKADKGWFLKDPLGLEQAWNHGYQGEGVKVAVMDTGIDFAHPDLYGKQARVEDTSSPYYGWPICFDGYSMAMYYSSGNMSGTWYADTSTTPTVTIHGATATASLSVSIGGDLPRSYTYTFSAESVSGVYHFGAHPDTSLWGLMNGTPVLVLLVDNADTATRGPGYNTIYVDLDGDLDFTDEKPCFRGDEISFRDTWNSGAGVSGTDGYPDVSGGMVYFIADGTRPIPASDWLFGLPAPAAGSLVAFMVNDYLGAGEAHGTMCASAVAAGGVINGNPPFYKPAYDGVGSGMVVGPAPETGLVAIGNYYAGGYTSDFHLFNALGYDGVAGTGDEPNVVSMSFGDGAVDADGWNMESRLIDSINQNLAPQTTWCNSTGNGGPGYMTVSSPAPPSGIAVGACTSYDTGGVFDSITSVNQIIGGDVQDWSCSSPQSDGRLGVSVMAHGAWGSGDLPLNEVGDGWTAWTTWGGTSRSCPEAAGVVALIYQAYKNIHAQWPTHEVARQILMNSAVDLQHDVFRQGAGRVHAGRAVEIAADIAGVAATPESWIPGNFRGQTFSAYAHLVHCGDEHEQQFTIANKDSSAVSLDVSAISLEAFNVAEYSMSIVDSSAESYLFSKPDYLQMLQGPGLESIPEDTTLMVLEAIYPFEVFDTDFTTGNAGSVTPSYENQFRFLVYDWTDQDNDGLLFDDTLGSATGVVEASEIDSGEYMRFGYGYNSGTSLKVFISDPLGKMHDGIFMGIQHNTGSPIATTIKIRATFYREATCSWLEVDPASLTVPGNATATLTASVTVPKDMPYGAYAAKIILSDSSKKSTVKSSMGGKADRTVIPVSINVAADLDSGPLTLPGTTAGTEPYTNYAVHGDFSWGGRDEAGDGRLFFLDTQMAAEGDYLITHTTWEDVVPTDLDTLIFGPAKDTFTDPNSFYYNPSFGPNTLDWIGGYRSPGRPSWTFSTSTGTTSDYSIAPLVDGLHALFVHNILFSGQRFEVPFSVDAGKISLSPAPPEVYTTTAAMVYDVTLTSNVQLDGFQISAYGPSKPEKWYEDSSIRQGWNYWYQWQVSDCGFLQVNLDGTANDIDLYLYLDGADGSTPDGQFTPDEVVVSSLTSSSVEQVTLTFPKDGYYCALANGYSVTSNTDTFNMTGRVISGHGVTFTENSQGTVISGVPRKIEMKAQLEDGIGDYELFLCLGPAGATQAISLTVPVTYYVPGDANKDGTVTIDDFFAFPLYWISSEDVPVGIDYDLSGKIEPGDLLEFLEW